MSVKAVHGPSFGYGKSPEAIVLGGHRTREARHERHIPVRYVGERATGITVTIDSQRITEEDADAMLWRDLEAAAAADEPGDVDISVSATSADQESMSRTRVPDGRIDYTHAGNSKPIAKK